MLLQRTFNIARLSSTLAATTSSSPNQLIGVCNVALAPYFMQSRGRRRSTMLSPWGIGKRIGYTPQYLTRENKEFLEEITHDLYAEKSPLIDEPWERSVWTPQSKRTGIICKKIGIIPQWNNEGERFLVTLLQVADNHVIKYIDPDTWQKTSRRGKKLGKGYFGCLVVGADSMDPQCFTAGYRGLFEECGVMPKKRLASFLISPDSKIQPGTRLTAAHFKVGQYVDCHGISQGHGFQGVMKRWHFKGGTSDARGNTKNHRRTGSIGTQGDAMVKPGKCMPGHMGREYACARGLKIWRINTKYNVLYVHGPAIPGPVHHYVNVRDSIVEKKEVQNPPFPTYYPEEAKEDIPEELFADGLFQFTQPTIDFADVEVAPIVVQAGVKVKKQAKAKK